MTQRLQIFYSQTIVPKLKNKLQYTHTLAVPKLKKIVINRGLGDISKESSNSLDSWKQELSILSGQTGVVTRSKKDIAGFKIRRKNPVGVAVTLRGNRMYGFLDRLINLALPRIRDFQGVSPSSLDGHGNYSIGLSEQYMFPEISYDKISKVRGMDISIVTSSKTDEECYTLLKEFGMPFKDKNL